MINAAPCIMFWMRASRAYPLLGQVGGGRTLEFEIFLGPVKWPQADTRVLFVQITLPSRLINEIICQKKLLLSSFGSLN
jgi:hypothetical protein